MSDLMCRETDCQARPHRLYEESHDFSPPLHAAPAAEPVPLTLDAERLRTIFEARMPDGCYILSDDGQGFSIVSPSSLADQIAHLYQTGDVLSGLAALRTTSSEGQDR